MTRFKIEKLNLDSPLWMVRQWISERVTSKDNLKCPACEGNCKEYWRKIDWQMAAGLVYLCFHFDDSEYTHIKEIKKCKALIGQSGGGDFAKLRHWKLVTQLDPNLDPDKRTSGFWKITEKGKQFAKGKILVPKRIRLYQNDFKGFVESDPLVSVFECLGEKFSYDELVHGSQN